MKRRYLVFLFFLAALIGVSLYFMTRNLKKSYDASKSYSSELTMTYSRDGNIEKCAWVNDSGEITWAEDKQYAYEIKTYNDENLVIREDFYDENGKPSYLYAGYCSVTISEEWPKRTYKYLDENGTLTKRNDGYSIMIRKFSSPNGKEFTDKYYDLNMNPFKLYNSHYGVSYLYDGENQIGYVLIDDCDSPMMNSSGYAFLYRTFYSDGKVETEMYFDTQEQPVIVNDGHYGIHISYYGNGSRSVVTSLDANGAPVKNSNGYVSIKYEYRENGTLEKELYLDINGKPCKCKDGSYGKFHDGDIDFYIGRYGFKYLPIDELLSQYPYIVVIVALLICILFVVLPKKSRIGLLILYFAFILFKTVFSRETRGLDLKLNPLYSYKDLFSSVNASLEIINNVWLFVPYGTGIKAIVNNKKVLVCLLLLPVVVELIQLVFRVGSFETADIINNGLGELIGIVLYIGLSKIKFSRKNILS